MLIFRLLQGQPSPGARWAANWFVQSSLRPPVGSPPATSHHSHWFGECARWQAGDKPTMTHCKWLQYKYGILIGDPYCAGSLWLASPRPLPCPPGNSSFMAGFCFFMPLIITRGFHLRLLHLFSRYTYNSTLISRCLLFRRIVSDARRSVDTNCILTNDENLMSGFPLVYSVRIIKQKKLGTPLHN